MNGAEVIPRFEKLRRQPESALQMPDRSSNIVAAQATFRLVIFPLCTLRYAQQSNGDHALGKISNLRAQLFLGEYELLLDASPVIGKASGDIQRAKDLSVIG